MKTMLTGAVCALALTTTLAAALPARAQTAAPEAGAVTLIQAGRLLDHPGRAPRGGGPRAPPPPPPTAPCSMARRSVLDGAWSA
ncbi:MAG: hypothetical protein RSG56_04570, partial [Brevundimonas sp.]